MTLGLQLDRGPVVEAAYPVTVRRGGSLRLTYTSRSGPRTAGWTTFAVSAVAGTALMVAGYYHNAQVCTSSYANVGSDEACVNVRSLDGGLFGAGAAVAGIGALVGVLMGVVHDGAKITFVPFAPASLGPHREGLPADPRGFQVSARF